MKIQISFSILKKDLYNIRFAIIPLIVYCIIMQITFKTVCPFLALTNIPCPACGLTHAVIYFFSFQFVKAFSANASVLLWIITLFLFFFDRYIHNIKIKPFPTLFIITGIITLLIYFVQLPN